VIGSVTQMVQVIRRSVRQMTPAKKTEIRAELERRLGGQMRDFKCSICGVDGFQDGQEMLIDRAGVVFCPECFESPNRCRRSNGTLRAWFASKEEAVAFSKNPMNTAYHGDIPVLCLKPGCNGWHLSQRDWPDAHAVEPAEPEVNQTRVKSICVNCGGPIQRTSFNRVPVWEHTPHVGPYPNTACRLAGLPGLEIDADLHATPAELDFLFSADDLKFLYEIGICL